MTDKAPTTEPRTVTDTTRAASREETTMSENTSDNIPEPPKAVTLDQLAIAISVDNGMDVGPDEEDRAYAERLWGFLPGPHTNDNEHERRYIDRVRVFNSTVEEIRFALTAMDAYDPSWRADLAAGEEPQITRDLRYKRDGEVDPGIVLSEASVPTDTTRAASRLREALDWAVDEAERGLQSIVFPPEIEHRKVIIRGLYEARAALRADQPLPEPHPVQPDLRALSDDASPGPWRVPDQGFGIIPAGDESSTRLGADSRYIVALVNAHREQLATPPSATEPAGPDGEPWEPSDDDPKEWGQHIAVGATEPAGLRAAADMLIRVVGPLPPSTPMGSKGWLEPLRRALSASPEPVEGPRP